MGSPINADARSNWRCESSQVLTFPSPQLLQELIRPSSWCTSRMSPTATATTSTPARNRLQLRTRQAHLTAPQSRRVGHRRIARCSLRPLRFCTKFLRLCADVPSAMPTPVPCTVAGGGLDSRAGCERSNWCAPRGESVAWDACSWIIRNPVPAPNKKGAADIRWFGLSDCGRNRK